MIVADPDEIEAIRARVSHSSFSWLRRTVTSALKTAWTDERALGEFVRQMPHNAVMCRLRPHMGPTRFTTWKARGSTLPIAWDDALTRLMESSAASGGEEP